MTSTSDKDPRGNAGARAIKGYAPDEVIGRHISAFYTEGDRAAGKPAQLLGLATADGRVEDEGWRVLTGWTEAEALGRPIDEVFNIVNEETRAKAFNPVTRVLAEGIIIGLANHTALVSRDGTERPIADSGAPIRDAEAIFMLDPSGRVATWNPGAEHIKGYRADEIVGAHYSTFFPPEDVAAGLPARELEQAARDGRFEIETWRIRKDGGRFWANVVVSAVRDASGRLIGFTKVTRDLTDRRDAEAERLRLAQAHEALRLRDEFLSIASHELETPLTALQLQLQGLQDRFTVTLPLGRDGG